MKTPPFQMTGRLFTIAAIALTAWLGSTIGARSALSQNQVPPALTPDQIHQVHSQLFFLHLRIIENGKDVEEIPRRLSEGSGDIYVYNHRGVADGMLTGSMTPVECFVCDSDLVVVGAVGTGVSHLTSDNSFLYTDWGVQVGQILKNNVKAPVQLGSSITVVTPGGKLNFNGRMVYGIDDDVGTMSPGQEFLAFMKMIPATGAYQLSQAYGFSGANITPICNVPSFLKIKPEPRDKTSLLNLVADAVKATSQMPECAKGVGK